MAGLGALLAPRRILAPPRRRSGRIGARRSRGVARVPRQLTLELVDPPRQPHDLPREPLVLRRQLEQHPNHRLPARVIDRLGLGPLHTTRFATTELCPPDRLNAYSFFVAGRTEPA